MNSVGAQLSREADRSSRMARSFAALSKLWCDAFGTEQAVRCALGSQPL